VGEAGAGRPQGHPGQARQDRTRARRRIPADAGNQLKKDYITAYIASHSKARLGVAEDKTRNALRKDDRLLALRVLAGVSLMPTSQLTAFDDKLDKLKSCASLVESELSRQPVCPHCSFRPANEQGTSARPPTASSNWTMTWTVARRLAADPAGQPGRPDHPGQPWAC
jgi:hypothetical protein